MKLYNYLFKFFCSIYFLFNLFWENVQNAKVIFRQMKLNGIPEMLPSYSVISGNFTQFEQFKILMLNMNVTRYQAKEV